MQLIKVSDLTANIQLDRIRRNPSIKSNGKK